MFVSYVNPKGNKLHRLWAEKWSQQYVDGTSALLLLDPQKSVYKAWNIPSSLAAAYGYANLWYYIKGFFQRGHLPAVQGEHGQLGADFVLAPDGTVLLSHYCQNPTDRVDVDKLVEAAKKFAHDAKKLKTK